MGVRTQNRVGTAGRRGGILLCIAILLSVCTPRTPAASESPSVSLEYQVKAAFVYKFLKFIEWPTAGMPDSGHTMVVGFWGTGPMLAALQSVEGKEVSDRSVTVRSITDPDSLTGCHVVVIGRSEKPRLDMILRALEGSSTLTISEIDDFAARGGMINFVIEDNKVAFEINPAAADRADLRISSKLLRLATIVSERK